MGFQWMSFSVKKNASFLKDSKWLDALLKADVDVYSELGMVQAYRSYALYRTTYKAFKTELKQTQATLGKLLAQQQKTIEVLEALRVRTEKLSWTEGAASAHKKFSSVEIEEREKTVQKPLFHFGTEIDELIELEGKIQANFKLLHAFLIKSKRSAD